MMAASRGISIGLLLLYLGVLGSPKGYSIPEGVAIQSECRDRYLWVHVGSSGNAPQFEAVDVAGVHPIDEKNTSRCGYTISKFKMDGYTTLRASYFSCHTDNQNDEVFTFQFNIIVMDAKNQRSRYPLSQTCSLLLPWSQREVICEEDYMEVTVGRDVPCTASEGTSKEAWRAAHSCAQNIANSAWQVMFLKNEDEMATIPIAEAHRLGYELSATPKRVVFRSPYRQNHSEIVMVDGVAVEVIHGTVFFSQKMMVVMIDISVACTINPGYFDGARLLWETPRIMTPLVHSGFGFESKQINVGVESQLLDEGTARARGYTLEVKGLMVQMGVPFGAEGGYRKSLVTNNIYREMYVAFLFYEHVFSHVYTDGSTVETRHRLLRVVDTPLLCRHPFTVDVDALPPYHKTSFEEHTFNVYLGNIPHDVALTGVKLNEKQFSVSDAAEHGYTISKIVHANGTHAYTIRVPFDDKAVRRAYLGEGLFQYSMDINYTLSIMPQEEAYYHLASVMEQLSNAFPPELKGVCTRGGIVFDMTRPRLGYLWEIGVGHDPLTPELVAERGYNLRNKSQILTLEVPLFTVGYTYEDINLRHFYGIFEIHSRDSRTSEIQTATTTRCLFKRDQLIICSTDGIMTVVTSTKTTWPAVNPHSTTLLDRTCKPKLTDDSRVLFEFGLNTCNTTVMVEDSSVVYENEILSYRELILDSAFISRDSKFRLTVRCLYPLSSVSRLFVDRIFKSEMPGVGSIKFTGSTKGGAANKPVPDCPQQVPTNTENVQVIGTQPSPSNHEVSQTGGHYSTNYGSLTADNTLAHSLSHYSGLQGSGASQSSSNVLTPGHYDTPRKVNPFLASYVYQNTKVQPGSNYNTDAQHFGANKVYGSSQVSNSFQQVPSHKVPLGDRAQGTSSYVKPATRDNFVVQGVDRQPTTSKVPEYSTYRDNQSGLSQVPGHDGLGHDETSFGEVKPTKAQLAPIKMLVPSQLSVNKYGPSKGQYAKPAFGHYGSSVGRTEIVHSGAKPNTDYYNTAQGTVYQASDNVQSTPQLPFVKADGSITQPNPSNTKPVHSVIFQSSKLDNSAASGFYGTNQDKNDVPVASKYDASKSNHVQPASNQYVGTQTSIVTPGSFSGTLQKLATSLHAASQPHNVQPTNSWYGATQHIAIKPALSQHQGSQSDRVKPATSKYVTLQHHSIQQVPGQDVSQSSSAKPAPSTSQSVPSQYDGSQSSRVAQAPIGTSLFQPNIIHHTSNQDRGPQSVRVKPTPKSAPTQSNINQQATGQYGGSQSYRVEPEPPQQIRIQPATSGIRELSPGQSASSHLNIDQQATSAYEGSRSHRRTPAPSKYGASTVQYAAKGHSNFIKVSSGGQPMVSQDTGPQDNPSCVSSINNLFNQGSAQSGSAQSVEKQQNFAQSHIVQNPPSHFQPTSQGGKINVQPDPIHGTTSNFHQPVQHGGHLQALNLGETTLGHHGSVQFTSSQLSPSQVKPASSNYSKYQDSFSKNGHLRKQSANGAYERAQGGNGQPDRRQHGSPLSFYRAVQVSAKKPLSMTSVQSPRYRVVQTGNIQRDRSPNNPSQYGANCLGCGETLSDHHGYISSIKGTQGGAENNPNNLNYISTEKGKATNLPKVRGNHIDAEGSHENCPDNSGPSSNNPLNPRSSDPGRYGGNVHEGILRVSVAKEIKANVS